MKQGKYRYIRIFISSLFLILFFFFSPSVNAQCDIEEGVFGNIQGTTDLDATQTAETAITTDLLRVPVRMGANTVWREYLGCAPQYAENFSAEVQQQIAILECQETNETVCDNINNQYIAYEPGNLMGTRVGGSVLGMAYFIENTLENEPLPVNYAYFFKDYVRRIPVVGERVFAADSTDYGHNLVNMVLDVWKITRNVAYGLMSVILLYVGLTIITRKRLNPQIVVTVQYALPKVILALVLIAFSYPIGAFITSLAWSLFYNVETIILGLYEALGSGTANIAALRFGGVTVGSIVAIIVGMLLAGPGVGIFVGLLTGILAFLIWGLDLLVKFKAFLLFIKMLMRIVSSPIEFAISAVPGNEAKITDWFKSMASLGLGIAGIQAAITTVHLFGYIVLNSADANFYGALFQIVGSAFIYIFGYTFALGVPSKIEKFVIGNKRR